MNIDDYLNHLEESLAVVSVLSVKLWKICEIEDFILKLSVKGFGSKYNGYSETVTVWRR